MPQEEWAKWLDALDDPCGSVPVPPERFEQFTDILPAFLLHLWREYGFAGFSDGRLWLCDPVAWAPIVERWLDGVSLTMGDDKWHAFTRDAFGKLQLFGERTGSSLVIDPVYAWLVPSGRAAASMSTDRQKDIQIVARVLGASSVDFSSPDGDLLFEPALNAHGPVGPDTIYGFVPALALGGPATVGHIEIVDALTHVELLTDLGERQILGDITMSL